MQPTIQIVLLEGGRAPEYATTDAAGMDLRCSESFRIEPFERKIVQTGIKIAIPIGYEGQIRPRSGLTIKSGLTVLNSPGTIDSDYRGEIGVIMINLGTIVVQIEEGERIAQLIIAPVSRAEIAIVDFLDETARGSGGFGSTGAK